jgi:hypothetical protein
MENDLSAYEVIEQGGTSKPGMAMEAMGGGEGRVVLALSSEADGWQS